MNLKEFRKRLRVALRAFRRPKDFGYIVDMEKQLEEHRQAIQRLSSFVSTFPHPPETEAQLGQMPDSYLPQFFLDHLKTDFTAKPVSIVDVGAQILDMEDHIYTPLREKFPCRIYGFEPLSDECATRSQTEPDVTMLDAAVGDGQEGVLNVTAFSPATSLFMPNFALLQRYNALPEMLRVEQQVKMPTKKLDDFEEIQDCDLLKVDIQGGELAALQGAERLLKSVMAIYIEVEFAPLYERQPLFPEVHAFLEDHGFELMDLRDLGYASYQAAYNGTFNSQLLWANGYYVRRDEQAADMEPSKLLRAMAIAHFIFQKYDYAARLLELHDRRAGTPFHQGYATATRLMGSPKPTG